jgi:hypothetical protein
MDEVQTVGSHQSARGLWGLLAIIVFVVAIAFGLSQWNRSTMGTFPYVSLAQIRLQQAVFLGAMIVLFWETLRVGHGAKWVAVLFIALGAIIHLYRMVTLGILADGGYAVSLLRIYREYSYPISILYYLLWMGAFALVDVTRIRRLIDRLVRLGLPVLAVIAFLAIYYGLHRYMAWAGLLRTDYDRLLPLALGVHNILRPLLFLGAFYVLHTNTGRARKRAIEWAVAGGAITVAFSLFVWGLSPLDWLGDAGVAVGVIGTFATLLPREKH